MHKLRGVVLAASVATLVVDCQSRGVADGTGSGDTSALSIDSLRCAQTDASQKCALYDVSMYELIANPRQWHGKRVRVIGFVQLHDEENRLYASLDDWRRVITTNSVSLPAAATGRDTLNHREIVVEATFDARSGGMLHHVTLMESWDIIRPVTLDSIPSIILKAK